MIESHFSQWWLAVPAAPCQSGAQDQALEAAWLCATSFRKTRRRQHRKFPRDVGNEALDAIALWSTKVSPPNPTHICSSQSSAPSAAFPQKRPVHPARSLHSHSCCWEGCKAPACSEETGQNPVTSAGPRRARGHSCTLMPRKPPGRGVRAGAGSWRDEERAPGSSRPWDQEPPHKINEIVTGAAARSRLRSRSRPQPSYSDLVNFPL